MKNKITYHKMEQRSPEWMDIRVGKIGGSSAEALTTDARMKTQLYKTVAEIQTGEEEEFYISQAMQIGIDREPFAKEAYGLERLVSITNIGYVTNSGYKYLGLSPDGKVGENGAVEIKCPMAKQHCKAIMDDGVPTSNRPQIALYFIVDEALEWVDFVSYNPDVKKKPLFIVRCTREDFEVDIAKLKVGYIKFYVKLEKYLKLF